MPGETYFVRSVQNVLDRVITEENKHTDFASHIRGFVAQATFLCVRVIKCHAGLVFAHVVQNAIHVVSCRIMLHAGATESVFVTPLTCHINVWSSHFFAS